MPYQNFLQQKNKNYFKKFDHFIQEGEVIFKKNAIVGLPEVSKLTELMMSKRQEDLLYVTRMTQKKKKRLNRLNDCSMVVLLTKIAV